MTHHAGAQTPPSLTATDRTSNRPADLWQYYMHGCVDSFATPIQFEQLLDPAVDHVKLVDDPIQNPYVQSQEHAVELDGKKQDEITFSKPLPLPDISTLANQTLRLYFWMKGINAGMREDIWKAPNIALILKDAKGKTLKLDDTRLHTVGDFDWHCYYLDVHIHPKTQNIYLQLENKVRGKAHFSHISFELVTPANDFSTNDQQDPITGSCAPNVYKDELPSHVQSNRGTRYPWHFLKGVKAIPAMTGQQYDIVTLDGLAAYFNDHPHTLQPYHRHHSIMYLPGLFYRGSVEKAEDGQLLWPNPDAGWIAQFAKLLLAEQDPKTGYWRTMHGLNMGLTFHYSNMLFRYYSPKRSDRELRTNPSFQIGEKYIPHANNIIDSTLGMQAHTPDGQLAAWSRSAYRFTTTPDADNHKCDFGTTWDAIYLLRIAEHNPQVDAARKAKVYAAIKAAFGYLLNHNILADGTWKLKDSDKYPTRSSYMYGLIEDTHWLEWRIEPTMPTVAVTCDGKTLSAHFTNLQQNSVRVFAVPKGFDISKLDETHMIGILQKSGHVAAQMDPYLGQALIRKAGNAMWGTANQMPDSDDWQYQRYTWWKLRRLSKDMITTTDTKALNLPVLDHSQVDLYITTANWYGEQSEPVLVPWP
jgi:hypothetical protein